MAQPFADKVYAAGFQNEEGRLLTYTIGYCIDACADRCIELWGAETFELLLSRGGKIVPLWIDVHQEADPAAAGIIQNAINLCKSGVRT